MNSLKLIVLTTMFISLSAMLGCDFLKSPNKNNELVFSGGHWGPDDIKGDERFTSGRLIVQGYKCCVKEDWQNYGSGWVLSGIVDNSTNEDLSSLRFYFTYYGKEQIVLGQSTSVEMELSSREVGKFKSPLGVVNPDDIVHIDLTAANWNIADP